LYVLPAGSLVLNVNEPEALIARSSPLKLLFNTKPGPLRPVTVPPTVNVAGGGGLEAPPPHPTMNRARNVTDPIERNMMIPLQWFADGVICRPKHLGVHEAWVKKGSCSLKIQEGRRASWPREPRTIVGLTRT